MPFHSGATLLRRHFARFSYTTFGGCEPVSLATVLKAACTMTLPLVTKLALGVNVLTEASCGINALLRDPVLACSFVGKDPVAVPLFGVALTSLAGSALVALVRGSPLAAEAPLIGLLGVHVGVCYLFGVSSSAAAVAARFPATAFQRRMLGSYGAVSGFIFHALEGALTLWGLLAVQAA